MLYEWDQGWILTTLSSILCVMGCSIIYLDDLYYWILPKFITSRFKFQIRENYTFLNGSLAFSSGCLLFTSLFRLLPEAQNFLRESYEGEIDAIAEKWLNFDLIISYIVGILICISFNYLLHLFTSESVVHCNHGGEHDHDLEHGLTPPSSGDDHSHSHAPNVDSHQHEAAELTETTPLVAPPSLKTRKSFIHYILPQDDCECIGECKGYSSAELCLYNNNHHTDGEASQKLHFCEIPELTVHPEQISESSSGSDEQSVHSLTVQVVPVVKKDDHKHHHHHHQHHQHNVNEDHTSHVQDHHHHVNSPISRLLLIGIQTTLAITLHKFPEGFITFITSQTNPELGVSIFLSLILHNFTEGFSMCLPLYYSFASGSAKKYAKLKAVSIAAVLGGFSQPLGAFIGLIFLKMNHANDPKDVLDLDRLNFIFGVTMSITAGFLSVIGLSMYGSAVSFGGSLNFVLIWCVTGMSLIGLSYIIAVD